MVFLFVKDKNGTDELVQGVNYDAKNTEHGIKPEHEALGIYAEELLQQDPNKTNMNAILHVNCQTGQQWYEYTEIPKTEIEVLREQLNEQAIALAALIGGAV